MQKFTNSSLICGTTRSNYHYGPRIHNIDTITPHCSDGNMNAGGVKAMYSNPATKSSCNYFIDVDGGIHLIVDESIASACSSNEDNDQRAITIELSSDRGTPNKMNEKVLESFHKLLIDICDRNNIDALRWEDDKNLIGKPEKQNITVHRWFSNQRSCPGDFLYSKLGEIADAVNRDRGKDADENQNESKNKPSLALPKTPFYVKVLATTPIFKTPNVAADIVAPLDTIGTVYTITDARIDFATGIKWGKLKSGAGHIRIDDKVQIIPYEEYNQGSAAESKPQNEGFLVQVIGIPLNVRTGPGTNHSKNESATIRTVSTYTIVDVKPGDVAGESKNGWGKLKSGAGWINLDYTKRV